MTISNTYAIPVDGDKVFRSNKHGQAELKKMPGVQRIFVENRDNSFINQNGLRMVKVLIVSNSKESSDACYQKGREMIMAIMKNQPENSYSKRSYTGNYNVPVDGDKIFRSTKVRFETDLRGNHPNCQIRVSHREKSFIKDGICMVVVTITGPSKVEVDALWIEGSNMVKQLLAEMPRSERSDPSIGLAVPSIQKETKEDFIKRVKNLIFAREILGYKNHEDCSDILKLILMRERDGIMDHTELGKAWQSNREDVMLDDIIGYEVPCDDWGAHAEIWQQAQINHPTLNVVA
uniref:Uncharacterized protein n=1 Tax=viral metagenome TaxID=1070528 RepID=A0A6C0J950_9ZZZZ